MSNNIADGNEQSGEKSVEVEMAQQDMNIESEHVETKLSSANSPVEMTESRPNDELVENLTLQ